MFKTILFDFDGTLANSLPMYFNAYDLTLRKFGFKFNRRQIADKCFGKTQEEICKNIKIPEKVDDFTDSYISNIKNLHTKVKLFPEVKNVLEFLEHENIKMGLATFAYRWYIDEMVDLLGIRSHFRSILSFDDVKNPKPNPEIVISSSKNLGTKTDDILVVGDTKGDILMGKNAGCKTVLFFPNKMSTFTI